MLSKVERKKITTPGSKSVSFIIKATRDKGIFLTISFSKDIKNCSVFVVGFKPKIIFIMQKMHSNKVIYYISGRSIFERSPLHFTASFFFDFC